MNLNDSLMEDEETCPAPRKKWDHKKARAGMTAEKRNEILVEMNEQYTAVINGEDISCAGMLDIDEPCNRCFPLIKMYRCFFCGRYFCPRCARAHFGDRFA